MEEGIPPPLADEAVVMMPESEPELMIVVMMMEHRLGAGGAGGEQGDRERGGDNTGHGKSPWAGRGIALGPRGRLVG